MLSLFFFEKLTLKHLLVPFLVPLFFKKGCFFHLTLKTPGTVFSVSRTTSDIFASLCLCSPPFLLKLGMSFYLNSIFLRDRDSDRDTDTDRGRGREGDR